MINAPDVPFNDLSRWNQDEKRETLALIDQVLSSGIFLNGPQTKKLQENLSSLLGDREVVLVGNGTDALTLALLALNIGPGDLVATVPNAGGYATGAILRVGAKPILIDVALDDAQMSPSDLQAKLEMHPGVRAVVVTHLYGLMAPILELRTIAESFGCVTIEDCAQSIGASVPSGLAGTLGDASTFSFYPTKNLGGVGDGGAVSFKSSEHALLARQLAQYGWTERYRVSHERGFNSRIDEVQAAVLTTRVSKINELNMRRREIAMNYVNSLPSSMRILMRNDESYIGHLVVLEAKNRNDVIGAFRSNKIQTSIHYPILDQDQPGWRHHFVGATTPNADELSTRIVSLPCFPLLSIDEINRVITVLQSFKD